MNTRRSVSAGRVERLDGLLEAMRSFWAAASALRGRETRQQGSLSMAQVRLAAALYRDGPLTGARLAETVQCSAGVASETLDQLERAGIVSRERSQSDRRAYTATLTEAGRQVVEQKIASLREQAEAALAARFYVGAPMIATSARRARRAAGSLIQGRFMNVVGPTYVGRSKSE